MGLEHAQKYKQKCEEIDECTEGIDTCDPNSNCINTLVNMLSTVNIHVEYLNIIRFVWTSNSFRLHLEIYQAGTLHALPD